MHAGNVFRDVDDVHNLMDDVAEQNEIANEISEAISNPVGFGQDLDEVKFGAYLGCITVSPRVLYIPRSQTVSGCMSDKGSYTSWLS